MIPTQAQVDAMLRSGQMTPEQHAHASRTLGPIWAARRPLVDLRRDQNTSASDLTGGAPPAVAVNPGLQFDAAPPPAPFQVDAPHAVAAGPSMGENLVAGIDQPRDAQGNVAGAPQAFTKPPPKPAAPAKPNGLAGAQFDTQGQGQASGPPTRGGGDGFVIPNMFRGGGSGTAKVGAQDIETVNPETEKRQQQGLSDEATARENAALLASKGEDVNAAYKTHGQAIDDEQVAEMRLHAAQHDQAIEKTLATLRQQTAEANAGHIDPKRWWGSKDAGQKAVATMAVVLGELGRGLMRQEGPSSALQMIRSKIDQDIDQQKDEQNQKGKLAEGTRNNLADLRAQFANEDQADAAARAVQWHKYGLLGEQIAAETGSVQQKQQAQILKGQAEQQAAAEYAKAHQWSPAHLVATGAGNNFEKLHAEAVQFQKDEADRGHAVSNADAWQHVVSMRGGAPDPGVNTAKIPGGANAGKLSPRIAMKAAEADQNIADARELQHLLTSGSSLNPSERARATALATGLRGKGFTSIPENPLEFFSLSGARKAGVTEVLHQAQGQKKRILEYGSNAGPEGPEAPE